MPGPLDGITILDLTIWQNGPWATVMLSDLGADVIKVEHPVTGDPGRGLLPAGGSSRASFSYFQALNRNKKSMTLNLQSARSSTGSPRTSTPSRRTSASASSSA